MDFSDALRQIRRGMRLVRKGWNGKGLFVFLIPGSEFPSTLYDQLKGVYPSGSMVGLNAYIAMKTIDGTMVPWLASQTDILSEDWEVQYEAERA